MRITKSIAKDVAIKLVAKKEEILKSKKETISSILYEMVLKTIPKEVLDTQEKHSHFFTYAKEVSINGNGFDFKYFELKQKIVSKNRYNIIFEPTPQQAKVLSKLINEYETEKQSIQSLRNKIEIALFNLRTYNKVSENFPEALTFLPKLQNTSIAVNFSDIRKQLK